MTNAKSAAAQYIRMSTDQQDLSPVVQRRAIEQYAVDHGLLIVCSYNDEGKSGMTIKQRPAMQRLLQDVTSSEPAFRTILVYDVSRWGRFQNTDASAYYEYHCQLHGVRVIYVTEPFADDGTPFSTLLKDMKRAMAAEYSRELMVKTRSGQEMAMQRGFQMGRLPCLGYRRISVSSDGSSGRELAYMERKPMLTDRVRWVLGPPDEVELVRRIFKTYTETSITIKRLAEALADQGLTNSNGQPLTFRMLSTLLKCEAFVGTFSWGRREDRTGIVRKRGDDGYTRVEGAVEPIVEKHVWDRAQHKRRLDQNQRRTKEEALEQLKAALKENPTFGITDLPGSGCATETAYRRLFGSFSEAMRLTGRDMTEVKAAHIANIGHMRSLGARFRNDLIKLMRTAGLQFTKVPRSNTFIFPDNIKVAVQLIWHRTGRHGLTWFLHKEFSRSGAYVLVVRMEKDETARDFVLMETSRYVTHPPWFHEPSEGSFVIMNSRDLIAALQELKPLPPYTHLPGTHRRLRYVTPLPIEVSY